MSVTTVEEERKDRRISASPHPDCLTAAAAGGRPEASLRYSEPCHAAYCDECDQWTEQPYVVATALGPTWKRDPFTGKFIMPEFSLAADIIRWVYKYVSLGGKPFRFTKEQIRLLYHIYAIDRRGRWVYNEITIQRSKGWGKDPFAAVLALVEMIGPCRFAGWNHDGTPATTSQEAAWVTVAAVAKAQTKNTMRMFQQLVTPEMKRDYGVVVGKEQVVAMAGARTIEAVTSSPATLEGNRPTFQIGNEPHHWKENNDGHELRKVMARNAAKIENGTSRICWITNAYSPSEMSVAQANREGWEDSQGDDPLYVDTGVLYDSLEAPEEARLIPREIPVVLEAVRGDAIWLDIERITQEILKAQTTPTEARRFYYNQINADDEAWLDPKAVDATEHPQVKAWRADPEIIKDGKDAGIRLGWAMVDPADEIVVFADGGKSGDDTAISGHRLSDGYTFAIGFWSRPKDLPVKIQWFAPRNEFLDRVKEVMGPIEGPGRFNVVALWMDPSHAKDDEDDTPYWDPVCDEIHRLYKDRLQFWAVKTGDQQHSVKWDMSSPLHAATFVQGAQEFVRAVEDRTLQHCGHPKFVRYMKNAKNYPTKWGTSLWKGARGSKRKIDGAVTHAGARMLGQLVLNKGLEEEKPKNGRVWGAW